MYFFLTFHKPVLRVLSCLFPIASPCTTLLTVSLLEVSPPHQHNPSRPSTVFSHPATLALPPRPDSTAQTPAHLFFLPRHTSLSHQSLLCSTPNLPPPRSTTHSLNSRQVNGQQIVNAQYNTPLNLYSEDNIAETLSAQAEVLGKGCLG